MRVLTLFILSLITLSSSHAGIKKVEVQNVTIPVMVRRDFNPVMGLNLQSDSEDTLKRVSIDLLKTKIKDIKEIAIYRSLINEKNGEVIDNKNPSEKLGSIEAKDLKKGKTTFKIKCDGKLDKGDNHLWVSVTPAAKASLNRFIELSVTAVRTGSKKKLKVSKASCKQRIGYAITVPNYEVSILKPGSKRVIQTRTSKYSRIPGLTCTKKGTLIATFDNRYHHNGDLPADIDVAISRSTDGGKSWSAVTTCIAARDLEGIGRGVGDPAILLDESNNRIWIASLASPKTGHPIWKSEVGTASPEKCGQFILAYSDDEGITWSKPINITKSVKRLKDSDTAKWGLVYQGPGNGICMRNGTLVFPAQIWGHKGKGSHWGLLVYSKDNGKTWTSSKAMKFGGSESQVAELSDGSLMLTTREGIWGWRQVGVTKDMGETWKKHDSVNTEKGRLRSMRCQACLISIFNQKSGKKGYKFGKKTKHALFFSNPNAKSRREMTLKVSTDDGDTWSKGLLYDQRNGMGYSAIYPINKKYMGVFYESQGHYLQFLKVPYKEIFEAK